MNNIHFEGVKSQTESYYLYNPIFWVGLTKKKVFFQGFIIKLLIVALPNQYYSRCQKLDFRPWPKAATGSTHP